MSRAAFHPTSIALAACAFALPAVGDANEVEIQLTPAGEFRPSDGRKLPVDHWYIDAAVASRVIERARTRRNAPVLDYEHQTLHKESNGQPAPAAGWLRDLVWREGQGLFARVELTARARKYIQDGEYKYVSPVFTYDAKTGAVTGIEMAAITNTAAIDGMQQLELRAAATFGNCADPNSQEMTMNKLLLAVCTGLALSNTVTEDEAIAALTAHFAEDPLYDIRKSLGLADDAKPEEVTAACTALKQKGATTEAPDPAEFVAVATFNQVKDQLVALTAKLADSEINELVNKGLEEGRLLPAQEQWARDLGKSNLAALSKYIETAQPIAALAGSQTKGKQPDGDRDAVLSADELAVCTATGIDPKDFAAAKAA